MRRTLVLANQNPILAEAIVLQCGPRILEIVEAARAKPLNRYNLHEGRIFGVLHGKERYKIIRVSGNTIVYKNLIKMEIESSNIDKLVELWNLKGVVEISPVDEIISKIKKWLEPLLGTTVMSLLIGWLLSKL